MPREGLFGRWEDAIEAGESNVTMSTLHGLAKSLGLTLAGLMEDV